MGPSGREGKGREAVVIKQKTWGSLEKNSCFSQSLDVSKFMISSSRGHLRVYLQNNAEYYCDVVCCPTKQQVRTAFISHVHLGYRVGEVRSEAPHRDV